MGRSQAAHSTRPGAGVPILEGDLHPVSGAPGISQRQWDAINNRETRGSVFGAGVGAVSEVGALQSLLLLAGGPVSSIPFHHGFPQALGQQGNLAGIVAGLGGLKAKTMQLLLHCLHLEVFLEQTLTQLQGLLVEGCIALNKGLESRRSLKRRQAEESDYQVGKSQNRGVQPGVRPKSTCNHSREILWEAWGPGPSHVTLYITSWSRSGRRVSCLTLSVVYLGARRPTMGLKDDGEGGDEKGEANFTPGRF
ncbi:hypothetical protein LIER_35948 [Lithospermum erythrorhizon]|uniref:Uncharacterized protein n=1 Tax=Lithospermum erythrorhizon TaxID=34254 RepID=A0AAV3NZV9_LITER